MYSLENNPLLGGISNKFREVGDISEEVVSFASLIFNTITINQVTNLVLFGKLLYDSVSLAYKAFLSPF